MGGWGLAGEQRADGVCVYSAGQLHRELSGREARWRADSGERLLCCLT